MRTRFFKPALLMLSAVLALSSVQVAFAQSQSYTTTANLLVPGELNKQLPGVTAYMTNGNNPLGLGGYEAVAPTTPVSNNATVTVDENGKTTVSFSVPNPVFTLQKIGGSSNATVLSAPRDSKTYAAQEGEASRTGRITSLTIELNDRSGKYVFNDCTEFPTLLGVDWNVPLTLNVDFSGIPETAASSTKSTKNKSGVNTDALKAIISTVETAKKDFIVSEDGKDVEPSKIWYTEDSVKTIEGELETAKKALSATTQTKADKAAKTLTDAYKKFQKEGKSGLMLTDENAVGRPGTELVAGKYTVSCNLWFNKADTGLPLNPHLTNPTFPPYNPVLDNAELVVKKDGTAKVKIPIVIPDKVMTLRSVSGMDFEDIQKNEDGAITELTVNLGKLSTDYTVVTKSFDADIEMGDLAMSISGLTKEHSWPATFELNLSGIPTKDGGEMPTVEVEMMNAEDADAVMALAGADVTEEEPEETESNTAVAVGVAVVVVVVIGVIVYVVKKKKKK